MKLKLLLILAFTTITVFSQKNKQKFRRYYLVNKFNDTTIFLGKKKPLEKLEKGFRIFDSNYKRTKHKVTPDSNFKYLVYIDKDTIKLKPLKPKVKKFAYAYTNAFMQVYIENSDKDIAKGKIDFYVHRYTVSSPGMMGPNGMMMGGVPNVSEIYYFKDLKGLHRINYKYHFKRYPKLLGKEKWFEMQKSKKSDLQFLLDYFTEYNNAIDKNNNKQSE